MLVYLRGTPIWRPDIKERDNLFENLLSFHENLTN